MENVLQGAQGASHLYDQQYGTNVEKTIASTKHKTSETLEKLSKLSIDLANLEFREEKSLEKIIEKKVCLYKEDIEESDINSELESQIDELCAANIIETPENSPFADTDLIIFKDGYAGQMPINGIKETEFNSIAILLNKISENKATHIVIWVEGTPGYDFVLDEEGNPGFKKLIVESLKILMTREIGRKLINKIESSRFSYEKLYITSKKVPGSEPPYFSTRFQSIFMPVTKTCDPYELMEPPLPGLLPSGELVEVQIPFFIFLAHEMIHASHKKANLEKRVGQKPTFERYYTDLEEQYTITGLIADISSPDIRKYNALNERNFWSAFSNKNKFFPPRIGHCSLERTQFEKVLGEQNNLPDEIDLEGKKFSDEAMDYIADSYRGVKKINFANSNITDAGLEAFGKHCNKLAEINLENTAIGDQGLKALLKHSSRFGPGVKNSLKSINISNTQVSEEGIEFLVKELRKENLELKITGLNINQKLIDHLRQQKIEVIDLT